MRLCTVIFLALYLTQVMRPFMPYVQYAVDYERIAREECVNKDRPDLGCNGKCYLMRQVKEAQQQSQHSGLPSAKETVDILVFHLIPGKTWEPATAISHSRLYHTLLNDAVAQQFCGEPLPYPPLG